MLASSHRASAHCAATLLSYIVLCPSLQDRKAEQEQEREALKAEILENSGPSMRDLELADLNRKLIAENLEVHFFLFRHLEPGCAFIQIYRQKTVQCYFETNLLISYFF
jgi:hypothetical protein